MITIKAEHYVRKRTQVSILSNFFDLEFNFKNAIHSNITVYVNILQ